MTGESRESRVESNGPLTPIPSPDFGKALTCSRAGGVRSPSAGLRAWRFLGRFRRGAPEVRAAREGETGELAELVLAYLRESGRRMAPGARERVAEFGAEFMRDPQARVLVTEVAGRIAGMVWCRVSPPDVWDDRRMLTVDWLYVRPEQRADPRGALALMRGAAAFGLAKGAGRVRITAEAPQLVARYQRGFDFVPEATSVVMGRELRAERER